MDEVEIISQESIPAPTLPGLTDKQSKFVEAYKLLNNGPKAAISAGYSAKSAHVEANRLLKHSGILLHLDSWRKSVQKKFSKDDFVDFALKDYHETPLTEPNRPRFLHLAGQGAGIIGNNDSRPNQTLNITLNKMELNAMALPAKWDALRKMLEAE